MADSVYVPPSTSRNRHSRYHEDEDCPHGPPNPVPWSRSDADGWDIGPCWACAGGERADTSHSNSRALEQKLLATDPDDI